MSIATISPTPWFTGLDDDGTPLVGGLLYTYYAGTTTPLITYNDAGASVLHQNPNPVVLDSGGRATVFLTEVTAKYILKRSDGSTVRSADNIAATSVGQSGGLGEVFFFGGDSNNPLSNTTYPSGATLDKCLAGCGVWYVDSATLVGTYQLELLLLSVGGGLVSIALVDLDDGSPDTPIVEVTSTSATGERKRSASIAFAAGGVSKNYAVKGKVASGSGYAWTIRVLRVA